MSLSIILCVNSNIDIYYRINKISNFKILIQNLYKNIKKLTVAIGNYSNGHNIF